ncbi:unnamed protein product [Caenorhabditis auriculariae]|uniref:Uncharacterized protein n=1 Tax=Caenorhabditis auriculariae TaxID=2777116 RepID=A0A8S1HWT1_9PELO|nr:unnamed protein product [Caenorhabditis auriculariae]
MDEEDVGIGVDFDYCQYEEKFYEETYRRNGDSSDDDSALSVSSPRDPPPFRQQTKNVSELSTRLSLRRAELLSISAYQYRLRGDQWVLSEARLVTHLLDFMDLPAKQHRFVSRICTDTVDPPLFSVGDCGLEIDDRYSFPPTSFLCPIQKSYLRSLGETILPYHRHLVELLRFCQSTPSCWKCFHASSCQGNMRLVDKLRRRLLKDTPRVLTCLYDQWQKVSLIYKVTASFLRRRTWKWEDVEEIWTSLFLLTSNQRLHPLPQREQLADLQKRCYEMLLRIMDSIYTLGKVPPGVADHFVLFKFVLLSTL